MIKVFQIQLNDAEMLQLQVEGWESKNPKIRAYGRRGLGRVEDVNMDFYTEVATVNTNDREEAFALMNLWEDPERVNVTESAFSMSVGDVLEMEDGSRWLCASFGFERI